MKLFQASILLSIVGFSFCSCTDANETTILRKAGQNVNDMHYQGAAACTSCHVEEAAKWSDSHHALAMQKANDSTVLASFDNQRFTGSGVSSFFFRNNGDYYVETEGVGGIVDTFKIEYTFGVTPLQQYLVKTDNGKIQALRTAWDTAKNVWYDLYPDQKIIPQDWLHWTKGGLNWNTMCAECHTTNLSKNYNAANDAYQTSFSEINVACEACHGAGEEHVRWADNPGADTTTYIRLTAEDSHIEQVRACAPCHSRKGNISEKLTFRGDIMEDYIPEVLTDGLYHPDGQILDEVYVYGSFTQSKMYHNGVRCTDCHDPHSLTLKADGNALCLQCHENTYATKEHSFHEEGSAGGLCINCHMTGQTYMGVDFRRDHSFRVPRPDQSVAYGTPNACTGCHEGKSASWAAGKITEWYGKERNFHFSDVLAPGRSRNPELIPALSSLLLDPSQPDIARSTAAYYLTDMPGQQSYSALLQATADSSSLVRYYALSGLSSLPTEQRVQFVSPLLQDSIRAVRIEAAELLSDLSSQEIPLPYQSAFNKAIFEYEKSLQNRGDFPMGQFMLGQFYYRQNDLSKATDHFIKALKMDTLLHISRENLARIYNQQGENRKAIEQLKITLSYNPENSQALYSLGLIYAELQQLDSTTYFLRQSVKSDPNNERAHYNLGLSYQHQEKPEEAEEVYIRGIRAIESSAILRQALAILYIQQGRKSDAQPLVDYLLERFPQEPQIQQLKQALVSM